MTYFECSVQNLGRASEGQLVNLCDRVTTDSLGFFRGKFCLFQLERLELVFETFLRRLDRFELGDRVLFCFLQL